MGPEGVRDDAIPRMPRGVRLKRDAQSGEWLLLAPERIIKTNSSAVEILSRCTGDASIAAIVDDIAAAFDAPRPTVDADVKALIASLASRRLVDL